MIKTKKKYQAKVLSNSPCFFFSYSKVKQTKVKRGKSTLKISESSDLKHTKD